MSAICTRATLILLLATLTRAHVAPWAKGMYCLNGTSGTENRNTNDAVQPLYRMQKSQWWMHHSNGCDQFPPSPGDFLEVPAGGSFTVEMANNRGQTTLSYNGQYTSEWPDGKQHPEDFHIDTCITVPNIHTQNHTNAAGSAFAISYESELSRVTAENLVVFSVLPNSPWKRLASFSVPSALPACPQGGCICVWGWVPNGCGYVITVTF
ncbi:hypothetical protein HGRIS_008986 [Hohenbuehelia grisea]|uniref:Uncharacterized protein n=1 Tax=Hohenbuehelia grisea TaxID=104357 RepID=A0ABR3J060_9AGAR